MPRKKFRPLWPIAFYRVSGHSMQPTYSPGDTLLGLRWFRPRTGQVVVAQVRGENVIKRIKSINVAYVTLIGDNPADSLDSRAFGHLPNSSLQAKILGKI